jgi:hypothetical protein
LIRVIHIRRRDASQLLKMVTFSEHMTLVIESSYQEAYKSV